MRNAILFLLVAVMVGCGQSCGTSGPIVLPNPGPTECTSNTQCAGGGSCERGVCIPAGHRFAGCTAVGRSCSESLCPGACVNAGWISSPKLCPSRDFPVPCVCRCP